MSQLSARLRWRPLILIASLVTVAAAALGAYLYFNDQEQNGSAGTGEQGLTVRVEDGATTAAALREGVSGEAQLILTLSAGEPTFKSAARVALVEGTPLSAAEIEAILARLPELGLEPGDIVEFSLPTESLPPPQPGETITQPFPPAENPPDTATIPAGPLEVLRFSPEGEIPLAPFLSVTFNQPMVPLATLETLASADVPVKLTPDLPGTWRWIGTKTLTFAYDGAVDRFPKATEYQVEIPAGTRSAGGAELAETVRWRFSTPAPHVVRMHPQGGPLPLDPLFFVAFDQLIEPTAVLNSLSLNGQGANPGLRLASESEIAADESVARLAEATREGTWLAFKASDHLQAATTYEMRVGPGTPSAEGPRTTDSVERFSLFTYDPLEVTRADCGYYDGPCPPLTPFQITFNNPLDTAVFTNTMLTIDPPLPGAIVDVFGHTINIRGNTVGQTDYTVTLSKSVQDSFGQQLGRQIELTFQVGSAEPSLFGPELPLVTLDPSATTPILSVYAINYSELVVQVYRVTPADWPAFLAYQENVYQQGSTAKPPGELVIDTTLAVAADADELSEVAIDLSEGLNGANGHLVVIIAPPAAEARDADTVRWQTRRHWVQVTQIGLDAFVDSAKLVAWTTDLSNGAPLAGVELTLNGESATTAADGTAQLSAVGQGHLVATMGDDTAILPRNPYGWYEDSWAIGDSRDELRWYVVDDRRLYRPGETVHIKGWLRLIDYSLGGDVDLVGDQLQNVAYRVTDPQGNQLVEDSVPVNALGGFDFNFTLPAGANLGNAYVEIWASELSGRGINGREYYHSFQIQEFRRPEFEVTARNETTGPYFVGESATVATNASFFAGGPLPNAEVDWLVYASPSSYSPPNWPDFTFGTWTPWWFSGFYAEPAYASEAAYFGPVYEGGYGDDSAERFSGTTDATGSHYLQIDFEAMTRPRPFSVMAEATVFDVNRQAWSGSTSLLVHPASLYVGLKAESTFVQQGTPLEIEAIVTDVDGNASAGRPIQVRAARVEWRYRNGVWGEVESDVQLCEVTSGTEAVTCTFATENGGEYRITATVFDEQGRENLSEFTRWVSGGQRPVSRQVEQDQLLLVPDKEIYQPGDTARILVQAPFSPAEGLLTVSRNGILRTERFQIAHGTATLDIPIAEEHIPNLHLQVDVVGQTERTDDQGSPLAGVPPRPAYASGRLELQIPPLSRALTVQAMPQQSALAPGETTAIDVTVLDAAGRPVPDAEFVLMVVDEAVLGLSGYQLLDPLAVFYPARWSGVDSVYGRQSLVLANPETLADATGGGQSIEVVTTQTANLATDAFAYEGEEVAMEESAELLSAPAAPRESAAGEPIAVRSDFNPLATFAPSVRTDANGQATIEVSLPDNLTRYRIMVVAVAGGKQYGTAEANMTARLPLMVRPSAPRFLNFGDQFEFPVVLQNQTDNPLTVDVVLQTSNLNLGGPAGLQVTVPANDRVEVRFPAATASVGTARYQVAAVSGEFADAASGEMPVYTPATTEAFAVYGTLDGGAIAQPLAYPEGVFPQFGGLEISTSSTALQALTDAVLYLTSHPYEGSEQIASRLLGIAALRDVLDAFEAEGLPEPAELEALVASDIETLSRLQNSDGGWPIWSRSYESVPYHSIHVAYALQMAAAKGYAVPADMREMALFYLRDIEQRYPSYYGPETRNTLSAYALFVRHQMGESDPAKAATLFGREGTDGLSLEALAWLWPVLGESGYSAESAAIARHFGNRAVETAGAANFTTDYGDEAYLLLHSDRRTDALILQALISQTPTSDLIPKVVNGLLAHQTKGRWLNTQENVFVLLALDSYFNTFESVEPEFVADIWLGETYAAGHAYSGRSTVTNQTIIPMEWLLGELGEPGGSENLILGLTGEGRLYYRLGLNYAPANLDLDPLDMGFVVQRSYEAVDDPDEVWQDEDGVWHIVAGARVRVRIEMVAPNRRYHVALVDPLAAGLEIINSALANTQSLPPDQNVASAGASWWWWGPWYQHQNLRDDRAEAFTSLLWEGSYTYSYIARATTPGTFIVPPAKAEEIYFPETFGRSGSDIVIVEPD